MDADVDMEYKTRLYYLHSPFPYENEQNNKNKSTYFDGWFTIGELRKMNAAFANKPEGWVPDLKNNKTVSVDLYHPYQHAYVVFYDSRIMI